MELSNDFGQEVMDIHRLGRADLETRPHQAKRNS